MTCGAKADHADTPRWNLLHRFMKGRSKVAAERISMRGLSLVTKIVPSEVRAHRFIELDSLRGIAAWVVAFGHFAML